MQVAPRAETEIDAQSFCRIEQDFRRILKEKVWWWRWYDVTPATATTTIATTTVTTTTPTATTTTAATTTATADFWKTTLDRCSVYVLILGWS